MTADSSELTFDIVAANFALLAPEETLTVAGTLIAELLLERFACNPLDGAAMVRATAHETEAAPDTCA